MLSLITLKALEEKLPKNKFMRIHKSFIVVLNKITSITKNSVFIGNSMFPVSDHFKDEFNAFVGNCDDCYAKKKSISFLLATP